MLRYNPYGNLYLMTTVVIMGNMMLHLKQCLYWMHILVAYC